jgi:ribosome biogenesis protein ERB1
LRKVPGYDAFLQERFDRCLDLYLCPRATKDKIDIDPESLIPKLPNPEDLRPFPSMLVQEYLGHEGHVRSISPSPCGQWLASGGIDATIRIWEVSSGRCMKVFRGSGPVSIVQWNPKKPLIAVAYEESIELVPVALGGVDESESLSCVSGSISAFANASCVWSRHEDGKRLVISLKNIVRNLKWHPKGDYFASCLTDAISNAVMVHKLSTKSSQCPFGKSKGHVQDISFHPSKPHFFVASKRNVRVYDLLAQKLLHKMNLPMQWVSRIDLHPDGNHLLLGSFDRRVCWYDLDMTSKPYKTLKYIVL